MKGLALALVVAAGCSSPVPSQVLGGERIAADRLEHGQDLYERYCAVCHGESGDGQGPSAPFLHPPPRDFRSAQFKFAGAPEGALASDQALARVIRRGLTGTAMKAWDLPESELGPIIDYIKTFSQPERGYRDPLRKPAEAELSADPYTSSDMRAAATTEGKRLYHTVFQCSQCHPTYAMPDEMRAWDQAPRQPHPELPAPKWSSGYRSVLVPPDFLRHPMRLVASEPGRDGPRHDVGDIHRVIATGMQGPMPGYGHLPPEQVWAVAHYVTSLVDLRQREPGDQLRRALIEAWARPRESGDKP